MPVLIILGNINQFTFANSIIAANCESIKLFKAPLNRIEVFHSKESFEVLQSLKLNKEDNKGKNWVEYLAENQIHERILVQRTVEVISTKNSVEEFVSSLEGIVSNITNKNEDLILDLTNGTTLSKNLLSTAAYLLDIPHQYMIDVAKLFSLTKEKGFIKADLLHQSYVSAPESTDLDNIAYLNLAEVLRYKRIIDGHSKRYSAISKEEVDTSFFKSNLKESVRLKLEGDQRKDNTIYRIATSSISTSAEDLISHLIDEFAQNTNARTFGEKLGVIRSQVERKASEDFDVEFFRKLNDFVLYLRNSSTHKGRNLTVLEKFKADLAVKMAFPFIAFYTDVVYDILSHGKDVAKPKKITELADCTPAAGTVMYYGLDGDDTGQALEELFLLAKNESHFKKISQSITKGIATIRNKIVQKAAGKDSIVFEAGDDLLFKGSFSRQELEEFKGIYNSETSGLTCSIGYGNSFHELYLAMKIAKTTPGKNSIAGAKFSEN